MKKTQLLITALCASALVLGACTPKKSSKKKKSSSQSSEISQSVTPGGSSATPGGSSVIPGGSSVTPGGSSTPSGKTLTGIAITTGPTKTVYQVGESFDPTGMVVTASYSDGSSENVVSQCTFSPSVIAAGTTSVTVSFGGLSQSQAITVAPSDWTAAQKAVFAQYLHGFTDVPYYYVSGASVARDAEYACVSYSGGTSSASLLETYAALFDSSWAMEKTEEALIPYYGLAYSGEKTITVGEDEITLSVSLYGIGSDGYASEDGTGSFCLDISDGYYYSWAEFKKQHQRVLDYFYDEVDEEGWPAEFPDTIDFEGSVDSIFGEAEYNDDEEISFYFIKMKGVSVDDAVKFTGAFGASPNWNDYYDAINEFDGYYHSSKKFAMRYDYNETTSTLLFFYGPYFDISTIWPEGKVASLISSVNNVTSVVVPALTVDGVYYEFDEKGDSTAYIFAFDPEYKVSHGYDDVEAYAAKFSTDTWFVDKIYEDPSNLEGDYFYIMSSKDHAVEVQISVVDEGGGAATYLGVSVNVRAPLVSAFPSSETIVSFFAASEITVDAVPTMSVASATGGFDIHSSEKYIDVFAFEATNEEVQNFLAGFTGSWALDAEQSDTEKGVYVFMYGETLARAKVLDYREEPGYHYVGVEFDVAKFDWTDEEKALFTAHLEGVIPPYFDAEISYDSSEDVFYFYVGESATQELINAYWAFHDDPAWVQDGENVSFSYSLGETKEIVAFWGNNGYFMIYVKEIVTAWTQEQADAFSAALHGIVPPYLGTIDSGSTATHFEGYDTVSEEELAKYDDILTEAEGWTKHETGAAAYFTKPSEDGQGYAKVWFEEWNGQGYYWVIEYVLNA